MTKIKIENEKEFEERTKNEAEKEGASEELLEETEAENFTLRKILEGEKKQTLEEIYNDETLKQIQKPPRAPIRRFFIGLMVGLFFGLVIGFVIAVLFLRYF